MRENGITYPEVECLIQISDFFEVGIDTLLKGTVGEPASFDTNEQDGFRDTKQPIQSAAALRQRNRNIRSVIAMILFIISPFYPCSPGADGIGSFLMILSIAVGIGLLVYNHKTKEQAE